MSRTTIKDIARALDINPSTVSRALKDHPDIGKTLKERIKKIADELGYSPNPYAVSLRNGKSRTIALIIPEISMYFFPSLIKSIEEIVYKKDYHLMVLHSNDKLDREINNARILGGVGIDGLLVSLTKETTDLRHFKAFHDNGVPIVYLDKTPEHLETFNVVMFGDEAAYIGISYLFNNFQRPNNICGIFGDKRLSITKDRLNGFQKALINQKYDASSCTLCFANDSEAAALEFRKVYAGDKRPDTLFVMSDELLAGIAMAINQLKIRVPEDLRIIALSDGFLPKLLPFPVPYVHTGGYELGLAAATLLFELLDEKQIRPRTHIIDTPIVK